MTGTVVKMRDGLRAGPLMLLDLIEDLICVKARLRDGALAHRAPLPVRAELDGPSRRVRFSRAPVALVVLPAVNGVLELLGDVTPHVNVLVRGVVHPVLPPGRRTSIDEVAHEGLAVGTVHVLLLLCSCATLASCKVLASNAFRLASSSLALAFGSVWSRNMDNLAFLFCSFSTARPLVGAPMASSLSSSFSSFKSSPN